MTKPVFASAPTMPDSNRDRLAGSTVRPVPHVLPTKSACKDSVASAAAVKVAERALERAVTVLTAATAEAKLIQADATPSTVPTGAAMPKAAASSRRAKVEFAAEVTPKRVPRVLVWISVSERPTVAPATRVASQTVRPVSTRPVIVAPQTRVLTLTTAERTAGCVRCATRWRPARTVDAWAPATSATRRTVTDAARV